LFQDLFQVRFHNPFSKSKIRDVKSSSVSRGSTAFEIFWRRVPPLEIVLGEFYRSGRKAGWSGVLEIVNQALRSA